MSDDQRVGNEFAALHVAFGFSAKRRAVRALLAQDVAGRNLFDAKAFLQHPRLRALARAGRPQENESHVRARLPFDEAPVVAHRQARFDLRDRIERDADDDQQRRRSQIERRHRQTALHRTGQHGEQIRDRSPRRS